MSLIFENKYLISFWFGDKHIQGYGSNKVDDKPTFKVMNGYLSGMWHYLVIAVDICCSKIDENVNDECDIN